MATRNRTLVYIQLRNSYTKFKYTSADSEDQNLIVKINVSSLPPKWVDIYGEIEELTTNITQNIAQLDLLHKKHLLPGFQDKQQEESQITSLTNKITADFSVAQAKIKLMHTDDNPTLSKNIQIALATKLQDLSVNLRKTQSNYMNRLESKHQNVFQKDFLSDDQDDSVFNDSQVAVIETNERIINQREKEINDIAKSINTIASIFKELQTMVIDQGTVLDRIDYNIEQTVVHMEAAHEELVKAHKYQDNRKAKYCIILLGVIIFILFMIILFKPRKGATTTTPTVPVTTTTP